ncbi:hypothetical protein [Salmonella phage SD-1_S14]|nr:hypothetical protein [Salmonella phage SD-1_S14]
MRGNLKYVEDVRCVHYHRIGTISEQDTVLAGNTVLNVNINTKGANAP